MGFNCNKTCEYSYYGIGCQHKCDCPDDECDVAKGCPGKWASLVVSWQSK